MSSHRLTTHRRSGTQRRLLSRVAAPIITIGLALSGAAVLANTDSGDKPVETAFAYQSSAYGTRVRAGDDSGSAGSGPTAWSILGCTKLAPISRHQNGFIGKVNANSMVDVGAVSSRAWTYRLPKKDTYGTRAVNTVADVVLGDPDGAHLSIGSMRSTADAFARSGTLGSATDIVWSDLDIKLAPGDEPATGTPLDQLVDAVNNDADAAALQIIRETGGVDITGVGRVSFGWTRTPVRKALGFARASVYGLRINLENGSRVDLGRARARIQKDMPAGVLGGHAYGLEATAADDAVRVGRVAKWILPCQGTDGEWKHNRLAGLHSPGAFAVEGVHSAVNGIQRENHSAKATTFGEVASVDVGDGQLVITGARAQANVRQDENGRIDARNIKGTTTGSISASGETQHFPAGSDVITIPGVAKIERDIVTRGRRSIEVTALRVTLLDGSGLVLELAHAKARIARH